MASGTAAAAATVRRCASGSLITPPASWASTPFTALVGVRLPVVQAPTAPYSGPDQAAAVSNAGGLGSISAGLMDAEQLLAAVRRAKELTALPFHVNLFQPPPPSHREPEIAPEERRAVARALNPLRRRVGLADISPDDVTVPPDDLRAKFRSAAEIVEREKVPVVSVTFGPPDREWVRRWRDAGGIVFGTATNVEEAVQMEADGVQGLWVQGAEGLDKENLEALAALWLFFFHGHSDFDSTVSSDNELVASSPAALTKFSKIQLEGIAGRATTWTVDRDVGTIGTLALTRAVCKAVSIPVVAAGGIVDGRGVLGVMALGASGAALGTAFLTSDECLAPKAHKEAVLRPDFGRSTILSRNYTGRLARGLPNDVTRALDALPWRLRDGPVTLHTRDIQAAAKQRGDSGLMTFFGGQAGGRGGYGSAGNLVRKLAQEVEEAIAELTGCTAAL
ncbi:MAG: hypothetical protein BJ554DRAFT_5237 [Olpidium bornovanus]|uniref:Nitronate monooxygenase domain-containing protein n=1 Tax=Olpidium bornovanus TaxID=278681 RepID=A0A8H8DDD8_9FUNG|nr:MAG: hypothetical protein BJ554DRAFT_5237 [Olpidium bornovanus]